jgi:hypothetical protein
MLKYTRRGALVQYPVRYYIIIISTRLECTEPTPLRSVCGEMIDTMPSQDMDLILKPEA